LFDIFCSSFNSLFSFSFFFICCIIYNTHTKFQRLLFFCRTP
jgi:hypothetical protein